MKRSKSRKSVVFKKKKKIEKKLRCGEAQNGWQKYKNSIQLRKLFETNTQKNQ
jgi:hypothetical protein